MGSNDFNTLRDDPFRRLLWGYSAGILALILSIQPAIGASTSSVWKWRNPTPQGNTLNDVIFANGLYVAVGNHGTVLTSPDAKSWSLHETGTEAGLMTAAFGNGRYVAAGPDAVVVSLDGLTWDVVTISGERPYSNARLYFPEMAFGRGRFLVSGGDGTILASEDGKRWIPVHDQTPQASWTLAYENDLFFALDVQGSNQIIVSEDGMDWTPIANDEEAALKDIVYGAGLFVGVDSTGGKYFSNDGTAWEPASGGFHVYPAAELAFGAGRFVLWGGRDGVFDVSEDGRSWTGNQELELTFGSLRSGFSDIAYGAHGFASVGAGGIIATSETGLGWIPARDYLLPSIADIAFHERFVGVSDSGPHVYSNNGIAWFISDFQAPFAARAVAGGPQGFLTVSDSSASRGIVFRTSAGEFWETVFAPPIPIQLDLVYLEGRYVRSDGLYASVDGIDWQKLANAPEGNYITLAHGGGTLVAIGGNGSVVSRNTEGFWQVATINAEDPPLLRDVSYTGSGFVAVGEDGEIFFSENGIEWERKESSVELDLAAVHCDGGLCVAAGQKGIVLVSGDNNRWVQSESGTNIGLETVSFGHGRFVIAGGAAILSAEADELAASLLALEAVRGGANNGIFLRALGPSGWRVRIERTESLTDPSWQVHDTVELIDGSAELPLEINSETRSRFYSIRSAEAP